ncbi:MAG: hypothetical protein G01um101425_456 [Candidatus Peregrinibacteria bacterium Gr01-1014_25]|nr:MAG: hypothetical protein G01um101425_456 [Candidatus Peregrinibacteria bacterium Gr01-1014_25]
MKRLLNAVHGFFFAHIPSTGIGMMRAAWGLVAGCAMLAQWSDVERFYSNAGYLPSSLIPIVLRQSARFSILDGIGDPGDVFTIYCLFLVALLCTAIGLFPRIATTASVLLLFSFHERNLFVLGGGDTVLRFIGFVLLLSPDLRAFSVANAFDRWRRWRATGTDLPERTMPIWPYRLLLWQFIVLYGTSLWFKLLGTMWIRGTAVAAAMHHPFFSRLPKGFVDSAAPLLTVVDVAVMFLHFGWFLMLVPRALTDLLPNRLPRLPLKRTLLLGGLLFHGSILLMMDAGTFSFALFAGYLGLLLREDIDVIRAFWNGPFRRRYALNAGGKPLPRIAVLYDGTCGLCRRSVFVLTVLDCLRRIAPVDFRDAAARKRIAPDITERSLDRAMHIRFPKRSHGKDKTGRTLRGFDAFRALAWHLPPLWPLAPFLYLPGVPPVGRWVYAGIAEKRETCDHESCSI